MLANVDSLVVTMNNGWVTNVDSLIVEMNNGWVTNVDSLIVEMNNGWVTNVDSLTVEMNNGWVTNVDSLIVEMNNGWVTNALLAFLFFFGAFTSCTYVQIYISISYPTNVVILLFFYFFFIRYLTCQYGARHTCPLSKNQQQQTKTINVQELC